MSNYLLNMEILDLVYECNSSVSQGEESLSRIFLGAIVAQRKISGG